MSATTSMAKRSRTNPTDRTCEWSSLIFWKYSSTNPDSSTRPKNSTSWELVIRRLQPVSSNSTITLKILFFQINSSQGCKTNRPVLFSSKSARGIRWSKALLITLDSRTLRWTRSLEKWPMDGDYVAIEVLKLPTLPRMQIWRRVLQKLPTSIALSSKPKNRFLSISLLIELCSDRKRQL